MSWRLRVNHTTGYRYESPVSASYNEARMTPLSTEYQTAIEAHLRVEPSVRVSRYWDYWGSMVHAFDTHTPHDELVVTASSVVETADEPAPMPYPVSWSDLADGQVRDSFYEMLEPTAATAPDDELVDVADSVRSEAVDPAEAALLAGARVRDHLVYQRGATSVSTSAVEAWRHGGGVCQDFVHLTLALLRAMEIPCRYVSGYFHPLEDAAPGDTVVGESHAWAEAWVGDWMPFDPTNEVPVGHRHILVARGRDYGDVTPLKGIYSGAPASTPTVSVELTRIG
jgi:transglutaminase-like putative cysteine protease